MRHTAYLGIAFVLPVKASLYSLGSGTDQSRLFVASAGGRRLPNTQPHHSSPPVLRLLSTRTTPTPWSKTSGMKGLPLWNTSLSTERYLSPGDDSSA